MQNANEVKNDTADFAQDSATAQNAPNSALQNEMDIDTPEIAANDERILPYDVQNDQLDALLAEATKTQEDERQASAEMTPRAKRTGLMPKEEAAVLAVSLIDSAFDTASDKTGTPFELSESQKNLFGMLFTPLTMKYGNAVMNAIDDMGEGAESEGYLAEIMAGAGLVGLGGTMYLQHKKHNKPKTKTKPKPKASKGEGENDGD